MLAVAYSWDSNRQGKMPLGILCSCQYASASCSHRRGKLWDIEGDSTFWVIGKDGTITYHRSSRDYRSLEGSILQPWREGRPNEVVRGYWFGEIERNITVPDDVSHNRPPLHPPLRQELGPGLRKSQLRLPLSAWYYIIKRGVWEF